VLEPDGSGWKLWDPSDPGPEDGLPQAPFEFPHNYRLRYTITLTNPNTAALTGVTMQVTDVLPPGLKYVTGTANPGAPGAYVSAFDDSGTGPPRDQDKLTWDLSSIPPNNAPLTFTFDAEVDPAGYGITFVNGAYLEAPTTGLWVHSNRVYHRSQIKAIEAKKTASIWDDSLPTPGYGTENLAAGPTPVELKLGDTLKYTLTVKNENPHWGGRAYDVVYVLDWSDSMESTTENFRAIGKYVAEQFSDALLTTYPGSRVSLMGVNMPGTNSNSGNEKLLNLQVDTSFYDASNYSAILPTTQTQSNTPLPIQTPLNTKATTARCPCKPPLTSSLA